MAKHVESAWSAKAGEALDYGSALGITAGSMCFYPMLEKAEKAMEVLQAAGEQPVRLGEIVAGDEGVILW